jgi:hypothetical protein
MQKQNVIVCVQPRTLTPILIDNFIMNFYRTNHNGKGKMHLLTDELTTFCGTKNVDFLPTSSIGFLDNSFIQDNGVCEPYKV